MYCYSLTRFNFRIAFAVNCHIKCWPRNLTASCVLLSVVGLLILVNQMSQKFRHFIGYLSISDFLKQIPPRNTLIILFFFYTHQSLSTKTKRFGAGCSSPGSWLKINGSVLRDQKVWKKTKELNMCRIYICFEKSLIDKFLRTLKKKNKLSKKDTLDILIAIPQWFLLYPKSQLYHKL